MIAINECTNASIITINIAKVDADEKCQYNFYYRQ